MDKINKPRPKHLALHKIKFPLPSYVSDPASRQWSNAVSRPALLLLLLFDQSLRSIETYTSLTEYLAHPLLKTDPAGFDVGISASLLRRAALSGDRSASGARSCAGAQQQHMGDWW